jgi:hypothetical protein
MKFILAGLAYAVIGRKRPSGHVHQHGGRAEPARRLHERIESERWNERVFLAARRRRQSLTSAAVDGTTPRNSSTASRAQQPRNVGDPFPFHDQERSADRPFQEHLVEQDRALPLWIRRGLTDAASDVRIDVQEASVSFTDD